MQLGELITSENTGDVLYDIANNINIPDSSTEKISLYNNAVQELIEQLDTVIINSAQEGGLVNNLLTFVHLVADQTELVDDGVALKEGTDITQLQGSLWNVVENYPILSTDFYDFNGTVSGAAITYSGSLNKDLLKQIVQDDYYTEVLVTSLGYQIYMENSGAFYDILSNESEGISGYTYEEALWNSIYMTMYAYVIRNGETYVNLSSLGELIYTLTEDTGEGIVLKENGDIYRVLDIAHNLLYFGSSLIGKKNEADWGMDTSFEELENVLNDEQKLSALITSLRAAMDNNDNSISAFRLENTPFYQAEDGELYQNAVRDFLDCLYGMK